jgi:hypothetical protein
MPVNTVTSIQTTFNTGGTASTSTDINAAIDTFHSKWKLLIRNSGLIKVAGQTGEIDWDTAPTTTRSTSDGSFIVGHQWWKLGGDRADTEPIYLKISTSYRRFLYSSTYFIFVAPHIAVGTLDEATGNNALESVDFLNGMSWPSTSNSTVFQTFQTCVRDNSVTLLLGLKTPGESGSRGWMQVARGLLPDGTTPVSADTNILMYANAQYRSSQTGSQSGTAKSLCFRHSEGIWRQANRTQLTNLYSPPGSTSNGAKANYSTATIATSPQPLYMKNILVAQTVDISVDSLHTMRMIDGNLGQFLALPSSQNVADAWTDHLSGLNGTTPLVRWE